MAQALRWVTKYTMTCTKYTKKKNGFANLLSASASFRIG
jgi:hypothetical protein